MTRNELEQKAAQWISDNEGKSLDWDQSFGPQCFDEFQFYNHEVVGAPFVTGASAKDIVNTYPQDFYDFIENTADNFPLVGDVPIWGTDLGPDGHVAVCKAGDPNTFTSLDQNWSWVPKCVLVQHSYFGVLGWLRPKTQEPVVQPAPVVEVTPTPQVTPIPVTVTTTSGEANVTITATSSSATQVPNAEVPVVVSTTQAKPAPIPAPMKAPMSRLDLIVWVFTNIINTLKKVWKTKSAK